MCFLNIFQRKGNESLALPLVSIIKLSPSKSGVYYKLSTFLLPVFIKSMRQTRLLAQAILD
jgi:hypothetical protein